MTPIFKEFLNWKLEKPNHFNQSLMLKVGKITLEPLEQALAAVVKHHDMLRVIYKDNTFVVRSKEDNSLYGLEVFELDTNMNQSQLQLCINTTNNRVQESFDIAKGPLFKAILYRGKEFDYLFLCAHHIAVDAVSWHIILEDLMSGYNQFIEKENIVLPKKTMSYQDWAGLLNDYAYSGEIEEEKQYWELINEEIPQGIFPVDQNICGGQFGSLEIELDEYSSEILQSNCTTVLGANMKEIILSVIAVASRLMTQQKKVGVLLESHGREMIGNAVVDRTVGWFTSQYPVLVTAEEDIIGSIISTKGIVKRIPNNGIGHGILRNLTNEESLKELPNISLNYFGNSEGVSSVKEFGELSDIYEGEDVSPDNRFRNDINLQGQILKGRLKLSLEYDEGKFSKEMMERFINKIKETFEDLVKTSLTILEGGNVLFNKDIVSLDELKNGIMDKINNYGSREDFVSIEATYSPAHQQRVFLDDLNNGACCLRTKLIGEYSQEDLNIAIWKMMQEQSVFRTGFNSEVYKMEEYKIKNALEIPFINLDESNHLCSEICEMIEKMCTNALFLMKSPILHKIVLIKVSPTEHWVYLFIHHSIWDLKSSNIWSIRLQSYLDNKMENVKKVKPYSTYLLPNNEVQNYKGNSVKDEYEKFINVVKNYAEFCKKDRAISTIIKRYDINRVKTEIISHQLSFAEEILKENIRVSGYGGDYGEVPLLLVHHGRNQENGGVIGLFLDAIPLTINLNDTDSKTNLLKKVENPVLPGISRMRDDYMRELHEYMNYIPMINVTSSYGVDFGDSADHTITALAEKVVERENGKHIPVNVMFQISSDSVKLVMTTYEDIKEELSERVDRLLLRIAD